jgi:membrane protein
MIQLPFVTSYRIIQRAITQFSRNRGGQMGAALAYYSLFSLAPLLVIAIAIAGAVFGEDEARRSAVTILRDNMGEEAAAPIEEALLHVRKSDESGVRTVIATVVLFFGAVTVFLQIRASFCFIWHIPPPVDSGILSFLTNYLLASVMVLLTGILLLGLVLTTAILSRITNQVPQLFLGVVDWRYLDFATSFLFVFLLLALIYRIMSGRAIPLRYVLYGATIAALMFTVGKTLLGVYLSYANVKSVYGAGGSVVAFLLWIYYSAQTMILGAELIEARRTRALWLGRPHSA